jgi:flagellin
VGFCCALFISSQPQLYRDQNQRQLGINQGGASKSMEKLSSGFRINRAGDDAAGLAISEKMRAQVRGLKQASRNAQDGISLIQTAEGALNETHSILQRMRELANQAATDTNEGQDRVEIQREIEQLKSEVDRFSKTTEFNTKTLLDGSISGNKIGGEGSALGEATSAKLESGLINPATWTTTVTDYQVTLDGKTFDVSGVEIGGTFEFFGSLETKLNEEIDTWNLANPNDTVEYAKFDIEVTSETQMDFTITSGSTGSNSGIVIKAMHEDGQLLPTGELGDLFVNPGLTDYTAGTDGTLTLEAADAIGKIGTTDTFSLSVNGHNIDVTLETVGGLSPGADDTIAGDQTTVAGALQKDINDALDAYKELTGRDFGNVTVSVKDGALSVTSSKPETVTMEFGVDDATEALGLAGAGTEATGGLNFHIGANKGQSINLQVNDMGASALEIADIDVSTREGADNAIASIDKAIESVSQERSKLGAVQNRLEHTISNLGTSAENLQAAESRIRDLDMADEIMSFTKNNILQQAATAMLAQANMAPQSVLQLLG